MAEITLLIGAPQSLTNGVVYRMPSRKTSFYCTAAVDVANDPAFALNATLAGNVTHQTAAQYLRTLVPAQIRIRA